VPRLLKIVPILLPALLLAAVIGVSWYINPASEAGRFPPSLQSNAHHAPGPEASLPDLLTVEPVRGATGKIEQLKIRAEAGIEGSARLDVRDAGKISLPPLHSERIEIRRGRPVSRTIAVDASGEKSIRVGLMFLDSDGNVSMSVHREVPVAPESFEPASEPKPRTDTRGAVTVTYPALSSEPRISGRR
jgi:hypothetical protein